MSATPSSDHTDSLTAESDYSDYDSAYGDDSASETASLRSAVYDYVYENGRRYNSYRAGSYWGPNDERAQDNLDLFHHIFSLSLDGRLYLAPIVKDPQRVLDLGTGTGIWAIDFADEHPTASVIATDLSPIQPRDVPPNLQFVVDDFTASWSYAKETFDFIHARSIYGCVADYPALYSEVYSALKPGGWFEQAEISVVPKSKDGTIEGTYVEKWGPLAIECGVKFGKSFSIAEDSEQLMKDAGFENVKCETFKWPIGTWPKERKMKMIGAYNRLGWDEGLEGWAMFLFTKFLGWKADEVQVLLAGIRSELRNPAIHAYQNITICYGQKPLVRGKD